VIELSSSSDEADFFTDTSRNTRFTKRLFGNLNRYLLRPLSDGKVIILSNSNEQ
jgi:hypothetical protein